MTVTSDPPTAEQKQRKLPNLGKEPTTTYSELDGRSKRFLWGSLLTMFTMGIVVLFLLPFGYMFVTSLKTESQIAQGTILPKSAVTAEYADAQFDLVRITGPDGELQAITLLPEGAGGAEAEVFDWDGSWDPFLAELEAAGADPADVTVYSAGTAGRSGSGVSLLMPGQDAAVLISGAAAPEPLEFDGSAGSLDAALVESGYAIDQVALFAMPDPDGGNPSLALLRPGAAINALVPVDQLPTRVDWDFTYEGLGPVVEEQLGISLDEAVLYTVPAADGSLNGVGIISSDGDPSAFLDPAVQAPEAIDTGDAALATTLDETFNVEVRQLELYEVPTDDGTVQLALLERGAESSVFVDPDDVDAEPILWEGRIQTIDPVLEFDPTLKNYPDAWRAMDFGTKLRNTAIIAGLGMAGTIMSSTLVAYGLSRFRMPFKGLIMLSLIATIILPRFVTLVPTYIVFDRLGWIGTWWPLIIPHFFANAYNVFLLRQFFLTIPRDLDEAAAIDGAGPLRTLLTVILPQAKGALLAVALFHFFFAWNDFLEPLLYLAARPDLQPISIGLYQFLGLYDANIPLIQAGALLGMLVPILVFLGLQKIFLKGIDLSGSVK
ncbi:MAG: carbohydrate ABC transporter permease [Ilumatobacter fluminis]|uniref:carbohydrate ABC transporter permease n=1 Tax=Ilumatobacter fluminis TaxID=467091 RepID=UPI0032EE974A